MVSDLAADTRFEVFETSALRPHWVQLANGAAAVLIATADDPLSALVYAVTAGIRTPVFVAGNPCCRDQKRDLKAAGASGFLAIPLKQADLDSLARKLSFGGTSLLIHHGTHLLLDPISRVARYRNRAVSLTQREFALLHCLSVHDGRPVAADELYRSVWCDDAPKQSHGLLALYVFQLRQKLAQLGLSEALKTVRRFGYALVPVDTAEVR